ACFRSRCAARAAQADGRGNVHRITVGSYNIHSCIGLDRRCSPQRIGDVLAELGCDVYALQEVHNDSVRAGIKQLDYLAERLGMTAVPGLRLVRGRKEY